MRVVTREVYYCDFCKRHRIKRSAIERHEPRCIYNPERSHCGWCCPGGNAAATRPIALIPDFMENRDVDWLREQTEGCPACMLAVVVQARKSAEKDAQLYTDDFWDFSYRGEVERRRQEEQEEWRASVAF